MLKILLPGATNWLYATHLEHTMFFSDFAKAYGYEPTKDNTQIVSKNPEINELIKKYQPQTVDFEKFAFQIFRADAFLDVNKKLTQGHISDIENTCRKPEVEELTGW